MARPTDQAKTSRVHMRLTEEDRRYLLTAAAQARESLSTFLLKAGLERASKMAAGESRQPSKRR